MSDTIIFGTQQILSSPQYCGLPSTFPTSINIACYLLPRSGTLRNFFLYQGQKNYSNIYPDGDSSATYQICVNQVKQFSFTIPGNVDPADTTPLILSDTTSSVSINAGDLLSFYILPADISDNSCFMGGGQLLVSCEFD